MLCSHYIVSCPQQQSTHVRLDFSYERQIAPEVVICIEFSVCSAVSLGWHVVDWCAALHKNLSKWMVLSHYCSVNYN